MSNIDYVVKCTKEAAEKGKARGDYILAMPIDHAAALVEALEKAQRHSNLTEAERQAYLGLIAERDERIAELEKAQQKVQTHERAELTWMNALELPDKAPRNDILPAIHAEKYALRAATKRIAELESRTVTVKLPDYRHERFWDCLGLEFNPVEYQAACIEMWREEPTPAGIHVEGA